MTYGRHNLNWLSDKGDVVEILIDQNILKNLLTVNSHRPVMLRQCIDDGKTHIHRRQDLIGRII